MPTSSPTLHTFRSNDADTVIPPALLTHLRQLCDQPRRILLGIAGAPGSGKSTLSSALMTLPEITTAVLPMDGFHLANCSLERLGLRQRKGAPDTFDADGYVALLSRIHGAYATRTVYAPSFERHIDEAIAGAIAIAPEVQLVITEGNYLLLDQLGFEGVAPLLDECWFVEVDDDLRRQRLQARHQHFGMSEQAACDWVWHTDEPNARLVASTRSRADYAIVGQ